MADLGITSNAYQTPYASQTTQAAASGTTAAQTASDKKDDNASNAAIVDTVEISGKTAPEKNNNTIKNPATRDSATIEKLKAEVEVKINSFRNLVESLFKKQGVADETAKWDGQSPLKDYLEKAFSNGVNPSDVEQAKKDVAAGGYWSVEETGNRILDFAKALIGDDMSKFDKIKSAILDGFGAAQDLWGKDNMPQITTDTLNYITEKLDEWEKNGSTAGVANTKAPDVTGLGK